MGGSKAKKTGAGKIGEMRKHHCPECEKPANPQMRMPGRKLEYVCEGKHITPKGKTHLR